MSKPTAPFVNSDVAEDGFSNAKETNDLRVHGTGDSEPSSGKHILLPGDNEAVGGEGESENGSHGVVTLQSANLLECAFNIFKGNVGSGVFLLPTFYKDAGYYISPFIALFIGTIVVDCSRLLVRAKTTINRKDVMDYMHVCEFVLGAPFRYVLVVSLILTQFGFCLMYMQLFGGSMAKLAAPFSGAEYVWMTIMLAIVLPVSFFSEKVQFLAIISMIATVCVAFALLATFVASMTKLYNVGVEQRTSALGNSLPFGWFNNMANNMMVLEGIGVVLPMENACRKKSRFTFMLTIVLFLVVIWYLLYGLTGYLAYGDVLTVSLIDELPRNVLSIVVRLAFTLNVLCTYPILFMPGILQLDSLFGWRPRFWKGILMRVFVSLIIYSMAMGAGSGAVTTVVSFIGALPAVVMLLLLPSLLSLSLETSVESVNEPRSTWKYWRRNLIGRPITFIRLRAYFYFFLGITIMVVGTYSIILKLI